MYRTGDAARITWDGTVQVLGRLDHQVKLRGFRIELAEIQRSFAGIRGSPKLAVVLREDEPGERRLVCYYADRSGSIESSSLRSLVSQDLPDYMIPSAWTALDEMPLTAAGKVDRQALPAPQTADSGSPFRPPQSPTGGGARPYLGCRLAG